MAIHPTAIVSPQAHIADSAEIGPYSIVEGDVTIGSRTRLMAHAYVDGPTTIGEDNVIFPYAIVGVASPDLKYQGEHAETIIGENYSLFAALRIPMRSGVSGWVADTRKPVVNGNPAVEPAPPPAAERLAALKLEPQP